MKTKKINAKKLNATVKQVMVTHEFGQPMYVKEATSLFTRPTLTPNIEDAIVWGLFDSNPIRLDYHNIVTGAKQLTFKQIN